MIKSLKIAVMCLMLVASMFFFCQPVHATQLLHNTKAVNDLFAVPEGGWSSIRAEVSYNEYFDTQGSNNTFIAERKLSRGEMMFILFFGRGRGCGVRNPIKADDNHTPVKPIFPYNEADENGEQDKKSCSPFSVA